MTETTQKPGVVFNDDGKEAIYTVGNGNIIHYKQHGSIYYHSETPYAVMQILHAARRDNRRIRIHLGNTDKEPLGKDWLDEHDVEGCVGNSMGPLKVPILLHNARSMGGGAILDNCIVKIRTSGIHGITLYQHPKYHTGKFTMETGEYPSKQCDLRAVVKVDGKEYAFFETVSKAQRWAMRNFQVDLPMPPK